MALQIPQGTRWLVTGAAGFIGSNLVEELLRHGAQVRAVDNYATGFERNYEEVAQLLPKQTSENLEIIEADIRDFSTCQKFLKGVDFVLHQAGLGSVPRSLANPIATNEVNVTGFLNVLEAARLEGVKGFAYAASSSTYGDEPNLPKIETRIGKPLSPYAVTKFVNEIYADVYARSYGFKAVGLRYFNVFGPRQDPNGAYAAVIPKWAAAMIAGDPITINGDGETSRDFCFVDNAVQANIRAALAQGEARGQVYNVAVGQRTSLNELFDIIKSELQKHQIHYSMAPNYGPFRAGDVAHSLADISKAKTLLGYEPNHSISQGLAKAMDWYVRQA